jgi:hypothetical protein
MISDFSSVWVDYLSAGKSIGLLIHDIDAYSDSRGLNHPPLMTVAASLELRNDDAIREFVEAVAGGRVWRRAEQQTVSHAIGFHRAPHRADSIVAAVVDFASDHGISSPLRSPIGSQP